MLTVFDISGNRVNIDTSKSIASGGEGTIYEHHSDVIKIYHTPRPKRFASTLVELSNLPRQFVKPDTVYYDSSNQVVGFSMRYIDMSSHWILKHLFTNSFCVQNGIDRAFKYKVYMNILDAVKSAHSCSAIIGDLNPYNILVSKTGDVVMIDVDSYGTPSKPHNGVLLEDIRDWVQHPNINKTTDMYAFDVLMFWMFTFLHPFRGDYPQHKNMEQRVIGKSSVLSKLPITIPKCYQPFSNARIIDQFREVFQDGKRFFVDMTGQPIMATTVSTPATLVSNDLVIQLISDGVRSVSVSDRMLAYMTDSTSTILNMSSYGSFGRIDIVDGIAFVGNSNYVVMKGDAFWHNGVQLTNLRLPQMSRWHSENGVIFIVDDNYQITASIDHIMSNQILIGRNPIYGKSLVFGSSVFQHIGNDKWLLQFNGHAFSLVKTGYNAKNVYLRHGFVLVEHVDRNKTRYTLCKVNNLKIEEGCDLTDFRYFDTKDGFVFVPSDGKIDLINPTNNWKIVGTIDCPVCTSQSRIFHTQAGMVIHTDDRLYLVNKKRF